MHPDKLSSSKILLLEIYLEVLYRIVLDNQMLRSFATQSLNMI